MGYVTSGTDPVINGVVKPQSQLAKGNNAIKGNVATRFRAEGGIHG